MLFLIVKIISFVLLSVFNSRLSKCIFKIYFDLISHKLVVKRAVILSSMA